MLVKERYIGKGVHPLVVGFSKLLLRVFGWRIEGEVPALSKYVLVAAPHTSGWDFFLWLGLTYACRSRCVWMGKESLFRPPLGAVFTWLGGIPIDRSARCNVVEQAIETFDRASEMVLAIPPEGTRKKTDHWKSGFYYIAQGAGVPMVLSYADFRRKAVGYGPTLLPSGDIKADMAVIREFYKDVQAKFPENFSDIRLRSSD